MVLAVIKRGIELSFAYTVCEHVQEIQGSARIRKTCAPRIYFCSRIFSRGSNRPSSNAAATDEANRIPVR